MNEGGGCRLLDSRTGDHQQLARLMDTQYGEKLFIGIQATQKVKRMGQTSAMKSRILAVTQHRDGHAMLYLFKAGGKGEKEKMSLKTRIELTASTVAAGETGTVLCVRTEDETALYSVSTEADRDFFLSSCTQHVRDKGNHRLRLNMAIPQGNDALDAGEATSPLMDRKAEKRDILTQEDMGAILGVLKRTEAEGGAAVDCAPARDARQLRDRVRTLATDLREANSTAIINGEREWTKLIASFEDMAVALSDVQVRLVQFTNNLGKRGDEITRVERERDKQAILQDNHRRLVAELDALATQLAESTQYLDVVESRDVKMFLPERRHRVLEAVTWLTAFEKRDIVKQYPIEAVSEVIARARRAKSGMGQRLFEFLNINFKDVGGELNDNASRAKLRPRFHKWPHRVQQAGWRELEVLMPSVLRLPLDHFLQLCRTYSMAMQESYVTDITKDYDYMRHSIKKRSKEMFYLGAGTKELMGLNLLAEMQSQHGGTSYAGSVCSGEGSYAGRSRISGAMSGCGYLSDPDFSGADPVPSRLQEHGITVYASDEIWDRQDVGDTRSRTSDPSSDGGSVGGRSGPRVKPGKSPLLPHGALIQSLLASVETALCEQEFIEAMFSLAPSKEQHVEMLKKMFNACAKSNTTILDAEFSRLMTTMNSGGKKKPRVDMMCLLPLSIVAEQLTKAPVLAGSPFILSFLSRVQRHIDTALLVWQGQQIDVIRKYTCTIKHKVVLPCYIRFSVFIKRIMEMCAPIPLPASFAKVQNVLTAVSEAMLESLSAVCKTDKKYADLFFLKNATYHLDYLRECSEMGSELVKALLSKEIEKMPKLQGMRAAAERTYIEQTLIQDKMSELFALIDELEGCSRSYGHQEVPLRFVAKKVGEALKHANAKDVKKALTTIIDRQNKHFFEHTPSNDMFLKNLFRATWAAAEGIVTDKWQRLEVLLEKCYPTLVPLICTRQQLAVILREIPKPNLEDNIAQQHGWQLPPRMPSAPSSTWGGASSRVGSTR